MIKRLNLFQALKKHIIIDHNSIDLNSSKNSIVFCYYCPVLNCRKNEKFSDSKFFQSRKHLVQHYLKVHSKNLGKFTCDLCSKKFSTQSLRNHHLESCGKVFTCFVCRIDYNSYEALLTHAKRKGHNHENITKSGSMKVKKTEKPANISSTRSVATTTVETSKLQASVFTSTGDLSELFPDTVVSNKSVASTSETKATTTDDISAFLNDELISSTSCSKIIKNSSTSTTIDFFGDNEDSTSSSNKRNVNLNSVNMDFSEDSLNIFDPNKFYSTETQTDFESLFNNNFTQTTFDDIDVFEKFDNQTQTNWIDLGETLFTSTETQTMNLDDDISFI